MRERHGHLSRLVDQPPEEPRRIRLAFGGVQVVRLQAERLKELAPTKLWAQLVQPLRAPPMDLSEQGRELRDFDKVNPAGEELLLPVLVRLRDSLHAHDVIDGVLEDEPRSCSIRQQALEPAQ